MTTTDWMTEEEIAVEVKLMQHNEGWPHNPMLPVKNRLKKSGGMSLLGVVFADNPTVFVEVDWFSQLSNDALEDAEKEKFDSWEDLIRAGWIGG